MATEIYTQALRRRAIQRFIRENSRAPTKAEANQLLADELAAYPTIDSVGFSGFDIVRPQFQDESSASQETVNRKALFDDALVIHERLQALSQLLEDSHRGFFATVERLERMVQNQEARVDKLLLLNTNVDVFTSGIEETFDTLDHIDFANTDASIESGYCVLARGGLSSIDLASAKITVSAISEQNILGIAPTAPPSALKEDDGQAYEYLVYTRNQLGRTTLVIDVELSEPSYVQSVQLSGLPIEMNKRAFVTLAYSIDGISYSIAEPAERAMRATTSLNLGLEGVRRVQIRISKDAADTQSVSGSQWVYIFRLDSLKIMRDAFTSTQTSTLIAGPYSITDSEGRNIYYTKATLDCCTVEPEGTAISWALSPDGVNWVAVDPSKNSLAVLNVGDGSASQAIDYIDLSAPAGSLQQVASLEGVNYQNEAVLNTYIPAAYVDKVPVRTIKILRNTYVRGQEVLGTQTGWVFDSQSGQYSTTLYVEEESGRWIDLGPTSAYVEGRQVTGRVFLNQGYTRFSTDDRNWREIEAGLTTADAVVKADPLYPYNHRYLVEGYHYVPGFSGEQVYTGVTSICGSVLSYMPAEEFEYLTVDDPRYYTSFTIENSNHNWYIKVKVNKQDSTWLNELYSIDWIVQNGPTNQIYVRAVLTTQDPSKTPLIESFNIRVI